jgi:hypothetical protein
LSADLEQLDENFIWETEHIPNIGDNVTVNLEHLSHLPWANDIGWIDDRVVEREFKACKDSIELTLGIERTVGEKLRRVILQAFK